MLSLIDAKLVTSRLHNGWRPLLAIDLLYKLISFAVLTPLITIAVQTLLASRGEDLLADVDIAMFFMGPFGWTCATLIGTLWLSLIALEQSTLITMLASHHAQTPMSVMDACRFSLSRIGRVLQVSGRLLLRSYLAAIPILLLAYAVYRTLLGEYDINYYLQFKPPSFLLALAIAVCLSILLFLLLFALWVGWFLSLPIMMFSPGPAASVIRRSVALVRTHRWMVIRWLGTWLSTVIAVHFAVSTIVGGVGSLLIPDQISSLGMLATRVGLLLLFAGTMGLIVNAISTILLSGILFQTYLDLTPDAELQLQKALPKATVNEGPRWKLNTARLFAIVIIVCMFTLLTGLDTLNDLRMQDDVEVMAHRGASFAAPENTLAAMKQAIADGADWVEIDVQETADGEVVVLHDSDFMKLAKSPLKIWNASYDDLQEIDIGSSFGPEFSKERVPKLSQLLELCKNKIRVNIELKYYGHDVKLEERVVEIVEATGMADQVMFMSLKRDAIKKMKKLRPTWKCGLLMSVSMGNLAKLDADFVAVNAKFVTRKMVQHVHRSRKQIYVWTVNDIPTMSLMMNRDVDGILTDRPDLARELLRERSTMSTTERLLMELATGFGLHRESKEQ